MIRGIAIVLLILGAMQSSGQSTYFQDKSVYELKLKRELILSGVGIAGYFLSSNIEKNEGIPDFAMGSFTQADIDQINSFDRSFAGRWDVDAKDKGKIFKTTATKVVPVGLLALPGDLDDRLALGLMYLQGRFINGSLVTLAKGTTDRYRPYTYLNMNQISELTGEAEEEFLEDIVDDDIEDSFYSGDAAATAYGLMFFAKVFNDYYPDSNMKYAVWGISSIGTGLGAYFRAKSGKHFPTDVIIGSVVGGGLGILIPHIHKAEKKEGLSFMLESDRVGLVCRW